jgi:membrane peptidoglycan carboxypeptidase
VPRSVEFGSGLVVETNLDVVMQQEAETLFPLKSKAYEDLVGHQKTGPLQIAGVALDASSGAVRALYGGLDLQSTGFNRATQSHRQPGSSFKPLVYALAFMQRLPDGTLKYAASSTEPNAPRLFKTAQGNWQPHNVGGESSVTASLAQGLTWSQNIATASLLDDLGGADPLINLANEVGFDTSTFPHELGLALGQAEVTPLEMAKLAATIANGGTRVEATTILRAIDARGVERITAPAAGPRVLTPEAAALTRDLMRLVIEAGTGGATRGIPGEVGYGGPAMGKTGTTDAEKDLWFVGATPKHAMVVWLGYDQPVRIGAAAADLAAPLWGWWMGHSTRVDGAKFPEFPIEPKVVKQGICTLSGQLPAAGCKVIWAPFLPGTQPTTPCTLDHSTTDAEYAPEAHESLWKRKAREAAEADAGI